MHYYLWTNNQDFYVENFGDEPQLSTSTSSVSTLSSPEAASSVSTLSPSPGGLLSSPGAKPKTTRKRSLLESWADKPMTKKEIKLFKSRLIEMVADCNMPFVWIERKSTKPILAAYRPTILKHIPSKKRLCGPILQKAATASIDAILPKMKNICDDYNCGFGFVCDSWVSVAKKHILGVIISASDMWFSYNNAIGEGNEIKDDEHNGISIASQIEEGFLKSEKKFDIIICCMCTDDAG
eukprot:CAMPEP_0184871814 /NCGR_PEP_ID=MMETSP0580-20130426/40935_1 /TAXON_ID=1118495 /ORGANISM="Dactyliosolen fragilissimus" /LENGTH=237 /DNA_ID=CAMNT_0027374525 /DNA_START=995 /DNA_END=1708 /DNA_ORIENTATION=+